MRLDRDLLWKELEMGMTWADDETGMLVITNVKGKKAKAPKAPKPPKAAKPDKLARGTMDSRPPVGLPIVRSQPSGTSLDRSRSTTRSAHRPNRGLRAIGSLFILAMVAAGGFAAGALTEVGTQAEEFVLGPNAASTPAAADDPQLPALQAELDRIHGELTLAQQEATELREAAAAAKSTSSGASTDDASDSTASSSDDKAKRESRHSRRSRRHR